MSQGSRAALLVQRIGPYHHARFDAWARLRSGESHVIEFRPGDRVYAAWRLVEAPGAYRRFLCASRKDLDVYLDEIQPEVIVCVGYADPEIHQAINWAIKRGVRLVTCSDSTYCDQPRFWHKEWLKRAVVAPFDAALVAGERSRDYLRHLGFAENGMFAPWDVVDNDYFARRADAARGDGLAAREKWGLPRSYFLFVGRFIPEKNLELLIAAYARYANQAGEKAWSMVLCGSGPLESLLRASVEAAGVADRVRFVGFLQYEDIPILYGLAEAVVLPSVSETWGLVVNEAMAAGLPVLVSARCGCTPDLIRRGENGFSFEPADLGALTARLEDIARLDDEQRLAMGRRSREIVATYSPVEFARGLEAAVGCALQRRRRQPSWMARWMSGRLAAQPLPVSS